MRDLTWRPRPPPRVDNQAKGAKPADRAEVDIHITNIAAKPVIAAQRKIILGSGFARCVS